MGVIKALLRIFGYIFGGLLALFVTAVCAVALANGSPLNFAFLPWSGPSLTYWLLGLALFGLLALLLAMGSKVRILFFLWNTAVLVLLLKGFFVSFYVFSGPVSFRTAVWLTVGSLLAALGSFPWPRKPGPVRRPQFY
ncbi:MAG TPA: hypothetical protein VMT32_00845 [Bryobacteraceae bacterium]|nr:hypothetical protein [Bryobacteraceae bacterium]